jgi:hypothetical protein
MSPVETAIRSLNRVKYQGNSLGKTGVGLGSPSTKSNPAQVRLGRESESGRWHGLSGVSRGVRVNWRHHAPTAPTQHLRPEPTRRGWEVAFGGVGPTGSTREESHDVTRVEDVKATA